MSAQGARSLLPDGRAGAVRHLLARSHWRVRYYGAGEELFEVTVTTHPEGRYTYTMDMQRSLRPKI
jgi:hypothetical protein